jgi:hypothetical protein
MPVRKWVAVIALVVMVNGTLHAQAASVFGTAPAPRPLHDAIARLHQPLLAAPMHARAVPAGRRRNSTATKVTAGIALGLAGFLVGTLTAFAIENAARVGGDGRTGMYSGGIIGAGAGAALGVWLASR